MKDLEFGKKVRVLRESKNLTREDFCEDESELTVRQLSRIESGASKPTLTKMQFIANRLEIGLSQLMPDFIEIPHEYQNLKYTILRTPTYGNQELLNQKDEYLNKIYDNYYDDLPEEEKIVIDTMRSMTDVYSERNAQFGRHILDDYFYQVSKKSFYTVNDLVILQLYFLGLGEVANGYSFDREDFDHIVKTLLELVDNFELDALFVLRDVLLSTVSIGRKFDCNEWSINIFDKLNEMMARVHDFQKKPILNMLMWQHYLFIERDERQAENMYQEAILFATTTGQGYLVGKLKEQWLDDKEGK